ncbi:MAG: hypothetical protein JST01_05065 [Cyanobacteria bacterium SZAS TMP-1]|nr:hypothetical protein [Cyanobacteria bacterium SZAS TMP-1]
MKDFFADPKVSFGDTVKVVSNELTRNLGLADLIGTVYGQTVPSISGVTDVIGVSDEDYAVNVFFDERNEGFWFAENLIRLVDHGAGMELRLDGQDKKWIRTASGEWKEEPL